MSKKPTRAELENQIERLKAKLAEQRHTHDQDIAQTKKAEEAFVNLKRNSERLRSNRRI